MVQANGNTGARPGWVNKNTSQSLGTAVNHVVNAVNEMLTQLANQHDISQDNRVGCEPSATGFGMR